MNEIYAEAGAPKLQLMI